MLPSPPLPVRAYTGEAGPAKSGVSDFAHLDDQADVVGGRKGATAVLYILRPRPTPMRSHRGFSNFSTKLSTGTGVWSKE